MRAPMGAIRSCATRATVSAKSSCSAVRVGIQRPPNEQSVSRSAVTLTVLGKGVNAFDPSGQPLEQRPAGQLEAPVLVDGVALQGEAEVVVALGRQLRLPGRRRGVE